MGQARSPANRRHSIVAAEARQAVPRPGFDLEAVFKRLDRNNDGKLIGDEIPEAQRENLMRLDANLDGTITLEEASRLRR